MTKAENTRRFRVYARHLDSHHARFVDEASFEAAAIAYVEDGDLPLPAGDDGAMRVIVHDVGTGREHCFRLDLATGETEPCGQGNWWAEAHPTLAARPN